ncbi:putative glycosyl transferase [Halobacteriovorax marinus SJ]|uniref:Glycosyl transferase n=1 Tax=Halobacteriovorax marinus (strain ATCC BAA-682 / DSM 15412 / SJ) TaxID=862908 RepID=E1X4W6_HALMS|nr:glycosyltransferase family 1 protein [Halobacteriovorax marinus]CBW27192.1 putative glycosyl transferase [Halobacteriovorax marinus SJ]
MKIGFDAKRALHNFRGLGNYSRTLIKSLDEHYSDNELYLFSPETKKKELLTWYQGLGDNAHLISPQGFISSKVPSLWRSFKLTSEIENNHIDIYHGLSHELPIGIERVNALKVVTIHDLLYLKFPQFFSAIDRFTYHKKFTYSCEKSDLIIAICEQTKADIIEHYKVSPDKIHVVYQSCSPKFYYHKSIDDLIRIKEKYKIQKPFIFHIATMEENKNTLGILKAYELIHSEVEEDLILIGRGKKYKQKVIQYIQEKNLSNRVRILDEAIDEDLPAIFQLAKLFVFPSFYEGFGIPIIEALFSKTPVVTSKGGCFPEAGGPNSRYVDPYDIKDISKGMLDILRDEGLQKEMAQKGHEFVQKFHWKNTANDLMNLYTTHL